jgi:hypothetical protein
MVFLLSSRQGRQPEEIFRWRHSSILLLTLALSVFLHLQYFPTSSLEFSSKAAALITFKPPHDIFASRRKDAFLPSVFYAALS